MPKKLSRKRKATGITTLAIRLQRENAELRALLDAALEKIEKYHAMVEGEYPGGMPNQVLLPLIRKALGK